MGNGKETRREADGTFAGGSYELGFRLPTAAEMVQNILREHPLRRTPAQAKKSSPSK